MDHLRRATTRECPPFNYEEEGDNPQPMLRESQGGDGDGANTRMLRGETVANAHEDPLSGENEEVAVAQENYTDEENEERIPMASLEDVLPAADEQGSVFHQYNLRRRP
jgi:hypothetical protein